MIPAVGPQQYKQPDKGFYKDPKVMKQLEESHDHVISANPVTQSKILADKFQNALTIYPAKGLTGSKNSNFYEFLTMGMVPYTIGSLMLMAVFNGATKYFEPSQQKSAKSIGHKMALGVLFYGILKFASKKLIEWPVYLKTGVDLSMPYKTTKAQLPESKNDNSNRKVFEYHKVFESVDFPRWDLLYYLEDGKPRNAYYDRVGRRMGLGEDLVDSDQEVKPELRKMVIRARTASTISSYLWAGLGVGLAVQDSWGQLFEHHNGKLKVFNKNFMTRLKETFKESFKSMWHGGKNSTKATSIAGKAMIIAAIASSVLGAVNSMFDFYKKKSTIKAAKINYDKDYTVS